MMILVRCLGLALGHWVFLSPPIISVPLEVNRIVIETTVRGMFPSFLQLPFLLIKGIVLVAKSHRTATQFFSMNLRVVCVPH